jgi:uncharacterized protein YoaH (UPF0181 family)
MCSTVFRLLIAAMAASIAFAAPAAADEGEYLRKLQAEYPFLTAEQLLSAGRTVCSATSSGVSSANALQIVQKDLRVSVSAAGDIVAAAVVDLDC